MLTPRDNLLAFSSNTKLIQVRCSETAVKMCLFPFRPVGTAPDSPHLAFYLSCYVCRSVCVCACVCVCLFVCASVLDRNKVGESWWHLQYPGAQAGWLGMPPPCVECETRTSKTKKEIDPLTLSLSSLSLSHTDILQNQISTLATVFKPGFHFVTSTFTGQ